MLKSYFGKPPKFWTTVFCFILAAGIISKWFFGNDDVTTGDLAVLVGSVFTLIGFYTAHKIKNGKSEGSPTPPPIDTQQL